MKTSTYYMADDTKKERGVPLVQYDTFEECVEAKGKDGVRDLVNERLVTLAQGKASSIKNKGAAKVKTEKSKLQDENAAKIAAAKNADPQVAALIAKYGLKF